MVSGILATSLTEEQALPTIRLGFGSWLHSLVTGDSYERLYLSEPVRGHCRPRERYEQHEVGAQCSRVPGLEEIKGQARRAIALAEHFQNQNLGSTSLKVTLDTEL